MKTINLTIAKRVLELECQDGEETKLKNLAAQVDERVKNLASGFGAGNDRLLLIMAAITMQDEINELKEKITAKLAEVEITPPNRPKKIQPEVNGSAQDSFDYKSEKEAIDSLEAISEYIENIAKKLETV